MAWEFLSAIYKSGWNKLTANNDNKTFRQCISAQFNRTPTNNMPTKEIFKSKQANISRISLPIPSGPSKSVLPKSKFYKKNKASNSTLSFHNWSYTQTSKRYKIGNLY